MNIFLKLVIGGVETAAESKLIDLLKKAYQENPTLTRAGLLGLKGFTDMLKPLALESPNEVDDELIRFLEEVIAAGSEQTGIELSKEGTIKQLNDDDNPDAPEIPSTPPPVH